MADGWDAQIYRERAHNWRQRVKSALSGPDREACGELAKRYEQLVHLIEMIPRDLAERQRAKEVV